MDIDLRFSQYKLHVVGIVFKGMQKNAYMLRSVVDSFWISNRMGWNSYQLPNLLSLLHTEVWEWISNFISHFIMD